MGNPEDNHESSSDDEDSWKFCKYCKLKFNSVAGFHMHLRGINHLNNEAKWQLNKEQAREQEKEQEKEQKKEQEKEKQENVAITKSPQQGSNKNVQSKNVSDEGQKNQNSGSFEGIEIKSIKNLKELEEKQAKEEEEIQRLYCTVCDIRFQKEEQFWMHSRGLAHYSKVEEQQRRDNPESAHDKDIVEKEPEHPAWSYCDACDMEFSTEGTFFIHVKTREHIENQEVYDQEQEKLQFNKRPDWVPAHEKDLTPFDIGKGGAATFFCEVCEVSCTGAKCFQSHLSGKNHLKKVKKHQDTETLKAAGISFSNPSGPSNNPKPVGKSILALDVERCSLPLIGVDYMSEFRKSDPSVEPRFVCDLCQNKMDPRQVMAHLTGIRHREKYFKHHAPRFFDIIWGKKRSEKRFLSEKFAMEIEKKEGRHSIRLRMQIDPFQDSLEKDAQPEWKDVSQGNVRSVEELPGFNLDALDKYKDYNEDDEDEENPDVQRPSHYPPSGPPGRPPGARYDRRAPPEMDRYRYERENLNRADVYSREPAYDRNRYRSARDDPYYYSEAYYSSAEYQRDYYMKYGVYPPPRRGASASATPARDPYDRNPQDPYRGYQDPYSQVTRDSYTAATADPYNARRTAVAAINNPISAANVPAAAAQRSPARQAAAVQPAPAKQSGGLKMSNAQTLVQAVLKQFMLIKSASEKAQIQAELQNTPEAKRSAALVKENFVKAQAQAKDLLASLGQCVVETEEDAEMALQISNSLTQALLGYRIQHLPQTGMNDQVKQQLMSLSASAKDIGTPVMTSTNSQPVSANNPTPIVSQAITTAISQSSPAPAPPPPPPPASVPGAFGTSGTSQIPGFAKVKPAEETIIKSDMENLLHEENTGLTGKSAGFERARLRKLQMKQQQQEEELREGSLSKRRKQADDMLTEWMNKSKSEKATKEQKHIESAISSAQQIILQANKVIGITKKADVEPSTPEVMAHMMESQSPFGNGDLIDQQQNYQQAMMENVPSIDQQQNYQQAMMENVPSIDQQQNYQQAVMEIVPSIDQQQNYQQAVMEIVPLIDQQQNDQQAMMENVPSIDQQQNYQQAMMENVPISSAGHMIQQQPPDYNLANYANQEQQIQNQQYTQNQVYDEQYFIGQGNAVQGQDQPQPQQPPPPPPTEDLMQGQAEYAPPPPPPAEDVMQDQAEYNNMQAWNHNQNIHQEEMPVVSAEQTNQDWIPPEQQQQSDQNWMQAQQTDQNWLPPHQTEQGWMHGNTGPSGESPMITEQAPEPQNTQLPHSIPNPVDLVQGLTSNLVQNLGSNLDFNMLQAILSATKNTQPVPPSPSNSTGSSSVKNTPVEENAEVMASPSSRGKRESSLKPVQKKEAHCALCYEKTDKIESHLQEVHGMSLPYVCGVCEVAIPSFTVANSHLLSHVQAREVASQSELQNLHEDAVHIASRHRQRRHIISDNDAGKVVEYQYNNKKTRKVFRCPYCNLFFDNYSWIMTHVREHANIGPFWCGFCKRRFVESGKLHSHIAEEHAKSDPYYCWCGLMCKKIAKVNQHQIEDHVDKAERKKMDSISLKKSAPSVTHCTFCDRTFQKESSFKEHIKECISSL